MDGSFQYKNQISQRMAQKRRARREAGLCSCGRQPLPDMSCCGVCMQRTKQARLKKRHTHATIGLCQCGRPPISGQKRCQICLAGSTNRNREWSNRGFRQLLLRRLGTCRTRQRITGCDHTIGIDFLLQLLDRQQYRCAISGLQLVCETNHIRSVSIDRIKTSGGYTEDNVQLVCLCMNLAKNKFSDSDLRMFLAEFKAL